MVNEAIGFSLWLDFIERDHLKSEFVKMVEEGVVNGATSNPAIFAASIKSSPAYLARLETLTGLSPKARYETLAIEDIRLAADVLAPLYEAGRDGFVSIEVDPFLCDDTDGTVQEGARLFETIGRPNVMIKVPATEAGYGAMKKLAQKGIPVNATLIFSPEQALRCLEALEEGNVRAGVLSVFVSRFDRMLDQKLAQKGLAPGRLGMMNAAKIYNLVEGCQNPAIRTLFASTGVKGDAYAVDYYIKGLMAPHSVNTAPLATIEAFVKNPDHTPKLPLADEAINDYFAKVERAGIEMPKVYDTLLREGLEAFKTAFAELLTHLE